MVLLWVPSHPSSSHPQTHQFVSLPVHPYHRLAQVGDISSVWSTNKPIAAFSCTPRVQEVHTKAEVVHLTPGLLGLGVFIQLSRIGNILLRHIIMINHRNLFSFGVRNKPIAAFSCTPRVQEVHTKAEVVHLTPGLLGLVVLFNCHA